MPPTNDDIRRIFEKLDAISEKINATNVTLATFMAESGECRKMCQSSYKAIFGNGSVGLKAKIWVIWGALGLLVPAVIALAVAAVRTYAFV